MDIEVLIAVLIGLAIGSGVLALAFRIMKRGRRGKTDKVKNTKPEIDKQSKRVVSTAVQEAIFDISDFNINPIEVTEGETVSISFKVANTGNVRGLYTANLRTNGEETGRLNIELAPGETELAIFAVTETLAGEYKVEVDGLEGMFFITQARLSVISIAIDPKRPKEKGQVSIKAEVANSGGITGMQKLEVTRRDQVLFSEEISVVPGASQRCDVTLTNLEPGTHEVRIGDISEVFAVEMENYFETL